MTVQSDLLQLAQMKYEIAQLNEKKAVIEDRIIASLNRKGQKTVSTKINGAEVKGTIVAPQRVVIDEQKVRNALDAKMWRKVTRLVLDKDKLEAAVAIGDVDANVVAQCSEIKDTKPYVKVTGDLQASSVAAPPSRKVKPPTKR